MKETTPYICLTMKEGYDRLLNALNKAIIITKKNAHTAVEMWIVAVD